MELIANGIGGVVPTWVDAYSRDGYDPRKWREVSFSGEPLSPEAELALYREFDVTDDPRPGILGQRHDSTRDLRWLQNAASYYDPAFRRALERLRQVRTLPQARSSGQPSTTAPERPVQSHSSPTAPRVGQTPKSPPAPRPKPSPAARPARPSVPLPSVSAQREPPSDDLPPTESVYGEARKLGLKGGWSPLMRWMFAFVLRGSGYLSWFFVSLVKMVAVFFDESAGVLVAWVTLVSIQYLCLAYAVDRLAPAMYQAQGASYRSSTDSFITLKSLPSRASRTVSKKPKSVRNVTSAGAVRPKRQNRPRRRRRAASAPLAARQPSFVLTMNTAPFSTAK
jgi:hypothetical protein